MLDHNKVLRARMLAITLAGMRGFGVEVLGLEVSAALAELRHNPDKVLAFKTEAKMKVIFRRTIRALQRMECTFGLEEELAEFWKLSEEVGKLAEKGGQE